MDTTCIICLEECSDRIFTKCCRNKICYNCIKDLLNNGYKICPSKGCYCKFDLIIIDFVPENFINFLKNANYEIKSNLLFRTTKTILLDQNNIDKINMIKEVYNMINYNTNQYLKIRISVNAACELLTICKTNNLHYNLYNLIVAMCIYPWNIPSNIGLHGVCYHGNMGDKPIFRELIDILEWNHKFFY